MPIERRDFLKLIAVGAPSLLFTKEVEALSGVEGKKSEIDFLSSHEIRRGDMAQPSRIIMTYDDWPRNPNQLRNLLDAYRLENQKTTFFFLGNRLDLFSRGQYKNYGWKSDDLEMIIKDGHEVACHGWQHETPMTLLSNSKLSEEFEKSLKAMKDVFGDIKINLFRAPYGSVDNRVKLIAASYGLQHVKWNVESGGVDKRTSEYVLNGVEKVGNGAIVLSHMQRDFDVSQSGNILALLKDQGYSMVTVSEGMAPEDRLPVVPRVSFRTNLAENK